MLAEKLMISQMMHLFRSGLIGLAAFLGICTYHTSTAQVLNIEDPSTPLDSLRKNDFRWGLSVSGNVSKQSLLVYDVGLVSECVYHRNDRHQLLFNAKYFKSGTGEGVLINSGYYYMRYTPWFHNRLAPQLFLQQQMDEGRGLRERNLVGMNLRFDALRKTHFSLQCASGIMQEEERWNLSGSPDASAGERIVRQWKANEVVRLNADLFENIELSVVNFFQFPFASSFQWRLTSQVNLTFKLNDWFSIQLNYQSMYDSAPVVAIPSYYYTSAGGLGVSRE
jgi:hypothetical protein